MPFTPAHVAIVTPLLKNKNMSALGLTIGAMAPDFEYFIRFRGLNVHSHTIIGLFYFDVPISFLLAWIFLTVVRGNLISNFPVFVQLKLQDIWTLNRHEVLRKRWIIFAVCAWLGAVSHLFWDAFTHEDTVFTRNLWFYHSSYVPFQKVKYPLWYALQHISTYIGLTIVTIYVFSGKPKNTAPLYRPNILYWICILMITSVVFWIRFELEPEALKEGNMIITIISGLCIGSILCGVLKFNNPILNPRQQDG